MHIVSDLPFWLVGSVNAFPISVTSTRLLLLQWLLLQNLGGKYESFNCPQNTLVISFPQCTQSPWESDQWDPCLGFLCDQHLMKGHWNLQQQSLKESVGPRHTFSEPSLPGAKDYQVPFLISPEPFFTNCIQHFLGLSCPEWIILLLCISVSPTDYQDEVASAYVFRVWTYRLGYKHMCERGPLVEREE